MADGYGFGAEGDWKACGAGPPHEGHGRRSHGRRVVHGGLHVSPGQGQGARSSARTCSRSARRSPTAPPGSPRWRSTRSTSAARAIPAALVFNAAPGPSVAASIIDMGGRMRMVVQRDGRREGRARDAEASGGARALVPRPDFRRGARRGCSRAARTTPRSARRSPASSSRTSPACWASSACASETTPSSARSRTSSAGTTSPTGWALGGQTKDEVDLRRAERAGLARQHGDPAPRARHLHVRQRLGVRRGARGLRDQAERRRLRRAHRRRHGRASTWTRRSSRGAFARPPTRRPTPPSTRASRVSAGSFTRTRPMRRPGRRPACRSRSTARRTRTTSPRTCPAPPS